MDIDIERLSKWKPNPRLVCTDGFSISVQASIFAYCIPRSWEGPYTHVECGYPSAPEPLLDEYKEMGEDDSYKTVYPYVPVEIVLDVFRKHGGLAGYMELGSDKVIPFDKNETFLIGEDNGSSSDSGSGGM